MARPHHWATVSNPVSSMNISKCRGTRGTFGNISTLGPTSPLEYLSAKFSFVLTQTGLTSIPFSFARCKTFLKTAACRSCFDRPVSNACTTPELSDRMVSEEPRWSPAWMRTWRPSSTATISDQLMSRPERGAFQPGLSFQESQRSFMTKPMPQAEASTKIWGCEGSGEGGGEGRGRGRAGEGVLVGPCQLCRTKV